MKIQYIAEIVSEFSGFHRTPGFKASRSTGDFDNKFSSAKNSRRPSTESNHSIHIHVGVDDVPILSTNSSRKPSHAHFIKNFHSSPSVSRMASLSRVPEKIQRKLKRSKSEESLESLENQEIQNQSQMQNQRKWSVSSYRLL